MDKAALTSGDILRHKDTQELWVVAKEEDGIHLGSTTRDLVISFTHYNDLGPAWERCLTYDELLSLMQTFIPASPG